MSLIKLIIEEGRHIEISRGEGFTAYPNIDSLIDALLFHGSNTERFGDSDSEAKSKQQLINTERSKWPVF